MIENNLILADFHFALAASFYKDANEIYKALMKSGLDDYTMGFFVWDIENDIEIYSPNFRSSLQYEGTHDFPNVPESWMNAIDPEDRKKAIENYEKHVKTKGQFRYVQNVRYQKKYKGELNVVCHGTVVSWNEEKPRIMIGVHVEPTGMFKSKMIK